MTESPPSTHATEVPGRVARVLGLVLALLVIAHTIVIVMWTLPGDGLRRAAGEDSLAAYVRPHFGQSWAVFAPVPRRVDEDLSIRARVTDPPDGKTTVTKWFNVTADDHRRSVFDVMPVRTLRVTHLLAGNIHETFDSFNLAQQDLVQKGLADPRNSDLQEALISPAVGPEPATKKSIETFLRNDEMIVRFATMYATARWGPGVEEVQYRLGRRTVPEYEDPDRPDFSDVQPDVNTFGWRQAIPAERRSQEAFDAWVER